MEKILIFIKHGIPFLWKLIEWINSVSFVLFYQKKMEKVLPQLFIEQEVPPFSYRRLNVLDAEPLFNLIDSQISTDLKFFSPHAFDLHSIIKQFNNKAFLMMGAFDGEEIVGYFFLRFFANKKCFVGRLIDTEYRGKGIGFVMNNIMYETAWRMRFHCLSTISRNNKAVMGAHKKNSSIRVLKELQNDYLLVEFVREVHSGRTS